MWWSVSSNFTPFFIYLFIVTHKGKVKTVTREPTVVWRSLPANVVSKIACTSSVRVNTTLDAQVPSNH